MLEFKGITFEIVETPLKFKGFTFESMDNTLYFKRLTLEQIPNHLLKLKSITLQETDINPVNGIFPFMGF